MGPSVSSSAWLKKILKIDKAQIASYSPYRARAEIQQPSKKEVIMKWFNELDGEKISAFLVYGALISLLWGAIGTAGYSIYKNFSTPDDVEGCYIEMVEHTNGIYRLKGNVPWHANRELGIYNSQKKALMAAEAFECSVK